MAQSDNFHLPDMKGTDTLAKELSMKILEGAKNCVNESRMSFGSVDPPVKISYEDPCDYDGYSSNDEYIDVPIDLEQTDDEMENDKSKGSLSSDNDSELNEDLNAEKVNDDSSLADSDIDVSDRQQPDVSPESSDCDENRENGENGEKKNEHESLSNSISSDSAFDDKFNEDKSTQNDLEKKVKAANLATLDGLKVRNVQLSDDEKQNNGDNASQCSSDSNAGSTHSVQHKPRPRHTVHFYDNKAYCNSGDEKTEQQPKQQPKRRAAASVSFAATTKSDDEKDEFDDDDDDDDDDPNSSFEEEEEKSTKKLDRKEWLRRQDFISAITSLLSLMYGGLLILLGFVFPLTEALHSQWLTTTSVAVFNVYLYLLSTIFLIYMSLDIWTWIERCMPSQQKPRPRARRGRAGSDDSDDERHSMTDEIYHEVMGLRQTASLSNEGASFYLRLGALLFGIANFIYVVVQIDQYYNQRLYDCYDMPEVYPMYFHLVFVGVQTFYIFKDTTVKVRRFRSVARFGFMHVLATNMCNWIRILVFEVMEGMYKTRKDIAKRTKSLEMAKNASYYENHPYAHSNSSYDDHGAAKSGYDDHGSSGYDDHGGNGSQVSCLHLEGLYMSIAPYLFPFVLEYSLIAAATMAGMYQSLNIRVTHDVLQAVKKSVMNRRKSSADLGALIQSKQESENMFAKSHRGMYGGAVLLAGALISMIMFHYTVSGDKNESDEFKALEIYLLSDIVLHVLLIPPVIYCAVRFSKFKFSFNKENTIDDTLLLISLSGLVLYYAFIILTTTTGILFLEEEPVHHNHRTTALSIVYAFCNIFQSVLQGIFAIAGLQLCAPNRKVALDKPGRGAITFLLIGNLALWLFKSFQVKEVALHRFVDFFGPIAWPIIMNTCLPLVLFYRFHVSVCLADIWASVYRPETGPKHKMLH